ncbi:MAG: methyltransferase domain-containing protein [Woeseiaceae bacterium]|nr:methyltransferase domain-containing protein [Woeseiaceae bacterium]
MNCKTPNPMAFDRVNQPLCFPSLGCLHLVVGCLPGDKLLKMKSTEFWDKRSQQYDNAVRKHDAAYDRTIETAKALLSHSDVVLDFGCGSGEFGLDLAPHVRRVHGIDTAARMIDLARDKAREREIGNTAFDQKDLFDRSLDNQTFSSVIAFSVFHLVDDAPTVLARLNDLLATGGLLISETPCFAEKNWLLRSLVTLAQKLGLAPKIRSLSSGELESFVSGSGFKIVESRIWDERKALQWIVARKK